MKKDLLSIIIVNYNGIDFLNDCIHSVVEHCKNINYEIILVDNNSIDNSIQSIEKDFPEVILIKNKKNLGFAAGNNIGVRHSNGEYILLLNNDTLLVEDIKPILELLQTNRDIGIVGIKMLDGENKFTPSFGKFPKFYNFIKLKTLQVDLNKIKREILHSQTQYINVDWISGAFLLTKKSIWAQVNGLDESYFMYVEDVDFNKKVQALNKRIVFMHSKHFIHYVGFNKNREKLLINSYMIYIREHKKGVDRWLSLFLLKINLFYKKAFKRI